MTCTGIPMTSIQIPSTAIELRGVSPRSAIALNGWPAVLFGAVFAVAGCGVIGMGLFAVTDRMHAPRTIIALVVQSTAMHGL